MYMLKYRVYIYIYIYIYKHDILTCYMILNMLLLFLLPNFYSNENFSLVSIVFA